MGWNYHSGDDVVMAVHTGYELTPTVLSTGAPKVERTVSNAVSTREKQFGYQAGYVDGVDSVAGGFSKGQTVN